MKMELLVSTMDRRDFNIVKEMNINSDAIIINQADKHSYEEMITANNYIRLYTFKERGIGLSRNNALMRSNADICLMADDDVVYKTDYEKIVLREFKKRPKADMIIFNVPIYKEDGSVTTKVKKNGRVRIYNGLKYGTVNFAFKRDSILKKNISFSLLFGASRYGSGEDSLFLVEMLKKRLKVYSSVNVIGNIAVHQRESSWFSGFNEKYLHDRGALFRAIGGKWSILLILQFLIRHRHRYRNNLTFKEAYLIMRKGSKEFK